MPDPVVQSYAKGTGESDEEFAKRVAAAFAEFAASAATGAGADEEVGDGEFVESEEY